jgi:tripartite-type tricarboxylate transporter receptor subunit TctC
MEISKFHEETCAEINASLEYQERAATLGEPQVYANSEEFTKVLMKGHEDMSALVKAIGLAK